jgi:hypothetical protein
MNCHGSGQKEPTYVGFINPPPYARAGGGRRLPESMVNACIDPLRHSMQVDNVRVLGTLGRSSSRATIGNILPITNPIRYNTGCGLDSKYLPSTVQS